MKVIVSISLITTLLLRAAQADDLPYRLIPARALPVPDTVSPEMRQIIARPADLIPADPSVWVSAEAAAEKEFTAREPSLLAAKGLTVRAEIINGVSCYWVTPKHMDYRDRGRLIVNIHGGGFALGGGRLAASDALDVAEHTGLVTLAIDYRLLPAHRYPAAIDDTMAVWQALVKRTNPKHMALWGSSAGGGLALSLIQRAIKETVALPAAIVALTPAADLSKTGDSYFTNAEVDNSIATFEGWVEATHLMYSDGRDLKDPLLSPVYGDFAGFPPTYLLAGTRDLYLSNAVRVARKLRSASVFTELDIYEGESHGQYAMPGTPEATIFFAEVRKFLDTHLGR